MTTTTQRERPILFSGPMVRAILAGVKTQTRRFVHESGSQHAFWGHRAYEPIEIRHRKWSFRCKDDRALATAAMGAPHFKCPYGTEGDRLWVREGFRYKPEHDNYYFDADSKGMGQDAYIRLSGSKRQIWPAIFMPRWASRITLEITDVRVQRLQDISEEDAMAEGCTKVRDACYVFRGTPSDEAGIWHTSPITAFAMLWDSINGKKHPWEYNPWVWCVGFRRITP